jgi:predicted nucleic acid-binding protein
MPVVSNTPPILNLAVTDRLSLIREQFTTVAIPKGVLEELRVGENLYLKISLSKVKALNTHNFHRKGY